MAEKQDTSTTSEQPAAEAGQGASVLGGEEAKAPEQSGAATEQDTSTTSEDAPEAKKEGEPNAADKVPEGEYDINLPEGMEVDNELATKAQPILKELGLTQEGADKLVALVAQDRAEQAQKLTDSFTKQREQWMTDMKNDAEIGGEKFDENVAVALKGVDTFGGQELKDVLNQTGLGNHPVLVKAFYKVGLTVKEDQPGVGGNTAAGEKVEDAFYKDTTPASGS